MLVKASARGPQRAPQSQASRFLWFPKHEATENSASFKYSPYTTGNEETLLVLVTEQSEGESQNKVKPVNQP